MKLLAERVGARRSEPMLKLVGYLSEHWRALAWTAFVGLANNLALVFLAIAGSYALTLALTREQLAGSAWWILAGVAVLLRAVLTWHEMDLSHSIAYRVLAALRMALFDGFSRAVPSRNPRQHTGRMAATAMGDTEKLEFFYAHTLTQLAGAAVLLGAGTAVLFCIGPALGLGWLAGLLVLALLAVPWLRGNSRLGQQVQQAKSDQSTLIVDLLSGAREIAIFGLQPHADRQLAESGAKVMELERKLKSREAAATSARECGALLILVLVFAAAWNEPGLDRLWIPAVVAGTLTLLAPIAEAASVLTQLQPHRASAARVLEGISLPAESPRFGQQTLQELDAPWGLHLDGVEFSYQQGQAALEPTSLVVHPGEHLGIAGPSGSGKTTLARILGRLWEPDSGRYDIVLAQGTSVEVASLGERAFRSAVTLVEQEPVFFHGTLFDNLILGVPQATEDGALRSLAQAGLELDHQRWPAGLETLMGESGTGVSGGERARLALARALLLEPKVLILDEVTASLDALNEQLIMDCLQSLAGKTTVITISHRDATLARCDRIVRLPGAGTA